MDEHYLLATVRYTELNPIRAKLCNRPEDWECSSVHVHLRGSRDELVTVEPMLDRIAHWSAYLQTENSAAELDTIRRHARTGRPIQDETFLTKLEKITGKDLRILNPGPKADTQ